MALGNISILDINDNELVIKDAQLTEIVNEIITAIGANNTSISERINDLHNRSFDAQIKISSANETEISNIVDGLYKLQYVTITGEGDDATETLNNSAILIQKSNNQYLIKDGETSTRTKTNDTWLAWESNNVKPDWEENDITSAAYIQNKPDLSHFLITETKSNWNETNTSSAAYIQNKPDLSVYLTQETQSDWSVTDTSSAAYIQNKPDLSVYLTQETQSDWSVTDTASAAYIQNKPTIPTVSSVVTENDTNAISGGAVYSKFEDLIGGAPAALDTLQEIAYALNNDADLAGTLTTQISSKIPKVSNPTTGNFAALASDGTLVDSSYTYSDFLTEHQSIKTVNNESLIGTGNVVVSGLPQVSSADNGKILMVVNGQWQLVSPSVLYSGQGVPNNAQGNNGDLYMQTD